MAQDLNSFSCTGRLTKDNDLRFSNSGMAICTFSIAVNKRKRQQDGSYQDQGLFFECVYFGKQAQGVSPYLMKGQQVAVTGAFDVDTWQDKNTGAQRSKNKIEVPSVTLLGGQKQGSQAPQPQRQQTRLQTQNVKQNPQQSYPTPQPQQMFAPQPPVAPENFEDDSFSDVPF